MLRRAISIESTRSESISSLSTRHPSITSVSGRTNCALTLPNLVLVITNCASSLQTSDTLVTLRAYFIFRSGSIITSITEESISTVQRVLDSVSFTILGRRTSKTVSSFIPFTCETVVFTLLTRGRVRSTCGAEIASWANSSLVCRNVQRISFGYKNFFRRKDSYLVV